jgi:hypothetical protein
VSGSPNRLRLFVASFEREEDLLAAARGASGVGLRVVDAHTPYAVHGLPEAMGLRPSRLPWVVLAGGLLGLLGGLALQVWTSSASWPLNVGGKPNASIPAFVPVAFELAVLLGGVGVVVAFLVRTRLRPLKHLPVRSAAAFDDRFALVVTPRDAAWDPERADRFLRVEHRAVSVEERWEAKP